ncbi:HET-domain-containing protein [Nemania sp. FL0916]|nr:HET-domain-containing protein [Nemania sp. FL0916]
MDFTNPHSCRHCEKVVLSRPDDNPDLHEGTEPLQSLLLLKVLRELSDQDGMIKRLGGSFLLEVKPEQTAQYVADGCLFYKFIETGLESVRSQRRSEGRRSNHPRRNLLGMPVNGNDTNVPSSDLIIVEMKDDAVEISTTYGVTDIHNRRYLRSDPRLLHNCVFGFFVEEGIPAAEKFESIASTNVASDQSLARTRAWLEDCVQNHPQCSHPWSDFSPTRLLKIWTHQGRRMIQLKDYDGTRVPYAALSYCWGGEQEVQTTKSTFARHRTRINFQDLPQTLRDAVIVTEKLGIEYLWVDALCIIQDDEEDRAREIELMGHVFGKAQITIMASRAESVQNGFLNDLLEYGHDKPDWVFEMRYRDLSGQISPIVIAPKFARTPTDYLERRAWAFQERVFSYRALEYSSTCVHWSCQTRSDCDRQGGKCSSEDLDRRVKDFRELLNHNVEAGLETWHKLVDTFSAKSLTIASDRLPAIGGIAESFGSLRDSEYLAGIWRSSLPSGLLWIVDRYAYGYGTESIYKPRSSTYLAPSWSWACVSQAIKNSVYVGRGVPRVDVVDADIGHQVRGTIYGAVTYGHLTLRGFLTPVTWKLPNENDRWDTSGEITRGSMKFSIAIYRDAVETELRLEADAEGKARVYLLVLISNNDTTNVTGLILRKHPDDKYSRLGVFDVPYCSADQKTHPKMAGTLLQGDRQSVIIM